VTGTAFYRAILPWPERLSPGQLQDYLDEMVRWDDIEDFVAWLELQNLSHDARMQLERFCYA
jgi:hypothetical protein